MSSHSAGRRIPATDVVAAAASLPFTRLVHFTPARNLSHILRDGQLRSSKDLADNAADQFSPTDHARFDAHHNHLCCSFEYPNAYYRQLAGEKSEYVNYPNWVHFTLDRDLVGRPDTLFSGCNAAKGHGYYLKPGTRALLDCWANPSIPEGWIRRGTHHPGVPTDLQAEVLIPGPVSLSAVTGIIVASEAVARELYGMLRRVHLDPDQLEWRVAPVIYNKDSLRSHIHLGRTPTETVWTPGPVDRA